MSVSSGYLHDLAHLPCVSAAAWLSGRPLLVVAPHPDDESLGAGGLIAAAMATDHTVHVVFLTDGEGSHVGSATHPPLALGRLRREEATAALGALGVRPDAITFAGQPDGGLSDLSPSQCGTLVDLLASRMTAQTVVCVTALTDPHGDHKAAFTLVGQAAHRQGASLWSYPVWTWLADPASLPDRAPDGVRIDIRDHVDAKARAVEAHRSQHGGVIDDAEEAFTLPAALLAACVRPYEVYLRHA